MNLAMVLPPAAALLMSFGVVAAPNEVPVDANIVTGLDTSDSIGRHEEWIEREGLARAVAHSSFLNAVEAGVHGRIGFSVYTWSSDGRSEVLVPWTVIASPADAARVSRHLLSARLIDDHRFGGGDEDDGEDGEAVEEHLTDTAEAIRLGANHLRSAPFPSQRRVINIVGNGLSNTGEQTWRARQDALEQGFIVNGLVLGRDLPNVVQHYQAEVIGGPGSFLLQVIGPGALTEAFTSKLRMDLASVPISNERSFITVSHLPN